MAVSTLPGTRPSVRTEPTRKDSRLSTDPPPLAPARPPPKSGPGATNLVTGIADAFLDSVPLVAITGQVPTAMMGTDAFQEVDIFGMTLPIVKHSFTVLSADEMSVTVRRAASAQRIRAEHQRHFDTARVRGADAPGDGEAMMVFWNMMDLGKHRLYRFPRGPRADKRVEKARTWAAVVACATTAVEAPPMLDLARYSPVRRCGLDLFL